MRDETVVEARSLRSANIKSLLLVAVVIFFGFHPRTYAQTPLAVEPVMREIAARERVLGMTPASWRSCDPDDQSGSGPVFPPDLSYAAYFDGMHEEKAAELIKTIAGRLRTVVDSEKWLQSEYAGKSSISLTGNDTWSSDAVVWLVTDLEAEIQTTSLITQSNYRDVFADVGAWPAKLTHIRLIASFGGFGQGNSEDSTRRRTQTIAADPCGNFIYDDCEAALSELETTIKAQPGYDWSFSSGADGVHRWESAALDIDNGTGKWSAGNGTLDGVEGKGRVNLVNLVGPGELQFYVAIMEEDAGNTQLPLPVSSSGQINIPANPLDPIEYPDPVYYEWGEPMVQNPDGTAQMVTGMEVLGGEAEFTADCGSVATDCDPGLPTGWRSFNTNITLHRGVIAVFAPDFIQEQACDAQCDDGQTDVDSRDEPGDEIVENPAKDCTDQDSGGDSANDTGGSNVGSGSSDGSTKSVRPISLAGGHKLESSTDIAVRVNGPDFTLSRRYSSRPGYHNQINGQLMGTGWSANAFRHADVPAADATSDITIYGPEVHVKRIYKEVNGAVPYRWEMEGPNRDYIYKDTFTLDDREFPVYVLVRPGKSHSYFVRPRDAGEQDPIEDVPDEYDGLLLAEIDEYTDTWRAFTYYEGSTGHPTEYRLCCIYLNPDAGTTNNAEAMVFFHWHWSSAPSAIEGLLDRVSVQRFVGNTLKLEVQQEVDYTYAAEDINFHADIGSGSDLVQVVQSVLVDDAPAGVDPMWKRVTQYRYHDGATATGAHGTRGKAGQLKMIIQPEQVEQVASGRTYSLIGPEDALLETANDMLDLADDASIPNWASGTAPKVFETAAKVIGYHDSTNAATGKKLDAVSEQYLQTSACGCSGGSGTDGLRVLHEYYGYNWPAPDNRAGLTTRLIEQVWDGTSAYENYRIIDYDLRRQGPNDATYLINKAIRPADLSGAWVHHYEYDESSTPADSDARTLTSHYTPAAVSAYTAAANNSAPSVTLRASSGKVYEYVYNSEHRRTETKIGAGTGGTRDTISKIIYESSPNESLVDSIERYRVAGASAADDKELTSFTYSYYAGSGALLTRKTSVERPLLEENGPGGTTYDTTEFFDEFGNLKWVRHSDNSMSHRDYDEKTGTMKLMVRNADPDGESGEYDSFNTEFSGDPSTWGRNSEGGSLITRYANDSLGRVTKMEAPGGVYSYTIRAIRAEPSGSEERAAVYHLATISLPHKIATDEYSGPAMISWQTASGKTFRSSGFSIDSMTVATGGSLTSYTILDADELSRSVSRYSLSGLGTTSIEWFDLDRTSDGFYETSHEHDELGRVTKTTNPNDTVTERDYDELGRVTEIRVGTTTETPITVSKMYYDDPDRGDESDTDLESGFANGNLSWVEQFVGDSTTRETLYVYDERDRRVATIKPLAPHERVDYDNLDRPIATAVFDGTGGVPTAINAPLAGRGRLSETAYDQRGQVYRQRIAINPTASNPSTDGYLESHSWYDEMGRSIGSWSAGGPASKTAYDGLGRAVTSYVTDRKGDATPGGTSVNSFSHVASLTGGYVRGSDLADDRVLEQVETSFNDANRATLVTTHTRLHDATATGSLGSSSAITTYVGTVYDGALRPVATLSYGTNHTGSSGELLKSGGAAPTVPADTTSLPISGVIHTESSYNERGLLDTSTDPEGHVTEFRYDDLNRQVAVIENHDGTNSPAISWDGTLTPKRWKVTAGLDETNPDTNRVTTFVYDGLGNTTLQVAHLPDSVAAETVQATQYLYGVETVTTPGVMDSLIDSNDLLGEVRYPKESTGLPPTDSDPDLDEFRVRYAYSTLGEMKGMEDQAGTRHEYIRDDLGRITADVVRAFGPDIDDHVKRVETSYDGLSRVDVVKSSGNANGGSLYRNAIDFDYTDLWQIERVFQDHDGEVQRSGDTPTGNTVVFRQEFDTQKASVTTGSVAGNFSRLQYAWYPLDTGTRRTVFYDYGTDTNAIDDRISRIAMIAEDVAGSFDPYSSSPIASSQQLAAYEYLGASTVAVTELPAIDVLLDRTYAHNGLRRSSGVPAGSEGVSGEYPGWDRFGRVQRHAWILGDSEEHATDTTLPAIPPIYEYTHTYDDSSNRLTSIDSRPGVKDTDHTEEHSYDGLDRLIETIRGRRTNPTTFDYWKGSQRWELDMLGNWVETQVDLGFAQAGDYGTYTDTNDLDEDRTHNDANEIDERTINLGDDIIHTYDDAGNLRFAGIEGTVAGTRYTHDAWNRLVRIETIEDVGGSQGVPAVPDEEYEYNGLNWRTLRQIRREYTSPMPFTGQQSRRFYYTPNWQLIEERLDEGDASGDDRYAQQFWGVRYIDDAIHRRVATKASYDTEGEFTDDESFFYLNDVQFSTVAMLGFPDTPGDHPELIERIRYDSYGTARHIDPYDLNGNGTNFDADDKARASAATPSFPVTETPITDASYDVDVDLDFNGAVGLAEGAVAQTGTQAAGLPAGRISDPGGIDNPIGYDGYVFNDSVELYTVRHRHYDTRQGRWLERDPLGYVDSHNLYLADRAAPTIHTDPYGLDVFDPGTPGIRYRPADKRIKYPPMPTRILWEELSDYNRRRASHRLPIYRCERKLNQQGLTGWELYKTQATDLLIDHSFILFGDPGDPGDYSGFGLYNPDATQGDLPGRENRIKGAPPKNCLPCFRNGGILRNGAGAGKTSYQATLAEIKDCIANTPARRNYHLYWRPWVPWKRSYHCYTWSSNAADECGLDCLERVERQWTPYDP